MKKNLIVSLMVCFGLFIGGCSTAKNDTKRSEVSSLETGTSEPTEKDYSGTYSFAGDDDDEPIEIIIDGKDVLLTDEYDTYDGTINSKNNKMKFEPEDESPFSYEFKLIGDKLLLKSHDGDYTLKKTSGANLPKKSNSSASTKIMGESESFSGIIVVGEDIAAGKYDVTPDGNEQATMKVFDNQDDRDADEYRFEWLFPADDENPEGDILKSYTLRDGNILDITGNMSFTVK